MVETFGANRGITPPMRKGVKGSDIRYNINDGFDEDYGTFKNAKWRLEARTRAGVADLQHYLGEDWIDYDTVNYYVNDKKSRDGGQSMVASKVLKCTDCNRAYETRVVGSRGTFINRYLPNLVFNNVPLESGECGICG